MGAGKGDIFIYCFVTLMLVITINNIIRIIAIQSTTGTSSHRAHVGGGRGPARRI